MLEVLNLFKANEERQKGELPLLLNTWSWWNEFHFQSVRIYLLDSSFSCTFAALVIPVQSVST